MFDPELRDKLLYAGIEILNKIGITSQMKYMVSGGGEAYGRRYIGIDKGNLVRAVLGTGKGKIREVQFTGNRFWYRIGVSEEIPYAALHEMGGVRKVTNKMRGFFRGRFETTKLMEWKYMQMADYVKFPKREYLWSAVLDNIPMIEKTIEEIIGQHIHMKISRVIKGRAGAKDISKFVAQQRFGGR